jgi:hypothetical protein
VKAPQNLVCAIINRYQITIADMEHRPYCLLFCRNGVWGEGY